MMDWWQFLLGPCIGIALGILGWHVVGPMLGRLWERRYIRLKAKGAEARYTATYQSTVSGGGIEPGGDKRDECVLEHVKHLASRHSELVKLEFGGEIIWTLEDEWIGGDDNG